jgi:hypothetical protein
MWVAMNSHLLSAAALASPQFTPSDYWRNLDWFRFWLQGAVDADPAKAEQYRRWEAMRAKRGADQRSNERSQVSADARSISRM